jgi:hypothetical protein
MFRELQDSNKSEQYLEIAARRTKAEMDSLIEAGYSQDEAWQMTRERYLILRPDEDEEDTAPRGTERTRAIFKILSEMKDLKNEADELEAQTSGLPDQSQRDGQD